MPQQRRSFGRRRRVLYQTHAAPPSRSGRSGSSDAQRLREARQPAKVFGSRVRQPLRGRWFSLVPVSTASIVTTAAAMALVPIVLTVLHFLTVTWQPLAYREDIARALRIDRADSFANWWLAMTLMVCAGTTFLIFQLRRHRSDDYRGHYRLWRLTLVSMMLCSLHVSVDLLGWMGAVLDWALGDRTVMSGANWLRIMTDVGGIILAMRLIAEVRTCRPALSTMIAGAVFLAYAEASRWNVFVIDSAVEGTFVVAGPLLGFSCLLISSTFYLRQLYRQARSIEDVEKKSVRERLSRFASEFWTREEEPVLDFEPPPIYRPDAVTRVRRPAREAGSERSASAEPAETETPAKDETAKPRRRWFGLRAAKKEATNKETEATPEETPASPDASRPKPAPKPKPQPAPKAKPEPEPEAEPKKKKGWFSLRLRPQRDSDAESEEDTSDAEPVSEQPAAKKKRGLGGFLSKRKAADEAESEDDESPTPNRAAAAVTTDSESDLPDEDDIDWNSMSKAERRRLRKKLRRQGKAA